jgi:hypothetical protein
MEKETRTLMQVTDIDTSKLGHKMATWGKSPYSNDFTFCFCTKCMRGVWIDKEMVYVFGEALKRKCE